ncbi:Ig-like domain-containing protein [Pantoea sp. SO10]|uniref:Ig-like domain-containing protein n=1 Tax=Pantoea sp. SO10 TaxID=2575375 RepID=UPI0010C9BFD0|nr:Ig-like domain-containing protein [Pantoea sp. SO10]QCP60087.1 hypothetical protein FCN45_12145 [Pantoea sp. SO10]
MNDLLARSPVFYRESADGRLVFGNKTALEPGGFIELVIGTDTFRVPVDDKGFYRWEAPTPYADGEYSFSIRHFDAAGNRSTPTLGTVIVDTTPPAAPDLINLYDDQGAVTGSFDAGKATDDKRPTLTGIAQKGSTVYLLNDKNEKIGSAVADKVTGKWVMEPAQDLKDGVNSLRLMAEETFGGKLRAGAPSQAFDIVIAGEDVKVTITDALDDAGSFTGSLGHGALTDDATPTLRGEVSAGSTVIVYYRLAGSPTWAGSATATVSGDSWSWTPGSNLPDGRYEFQASTGEVASVLFELEIAGTAGIAQRTRIESVTDDFGPVTGPLANGAMTDDATPTFQGRAEANSQVVIRYTLAGGAAASVTVNADSTGHWRWTPGVSLATGQWTFDVKSQGQSGWNDSFTLTINPDADRNATIDSALDNVGPVTGSLASGSSTDDTTPTLRGSGPANSEITLRYKLGNGGYTYITVNVDSSGHWTWTPSALAKGSWTFEVQKTGQSDWSSFTLTVDPTLDRNATINSAYDDFGTVKGIIANGGITDDATPTLNGSGPANSVISLRYRLGSGEYASTTVNVDANGNWTWTPSALASGKWTFEVQKPGQSGWSSFTLTIDPTVDRKPTIDSAWDDVGPTTGLVNNGGTTDDSTPTLRGTGPANSTILLRYFRLATMFEGTIKVDASGNWTWTAPQLEDGNWTFEVKKEGQSQWSSYELTIDSDADRYPTIDSALDNAGPVTGSLSSGSSTDDTTPTLRGSGAANSTITLRYKLGSGEYASTTVNVDNAGHWTWTPSALAKGSWTFEVQKAGQSGWSSFTLTIDPALDLKPSIDSAWDDFGAVTGSLKSGDATDDSTPTLRGKGVAGSVIYFQSGTAGGSWYDVGSTVVKADGSWEWTSPALSRNGTWEFRAKASHGGVDSTWTGKFILKYTAAEAPAITDALDNAGPVTGSLSSGSSTDDTTPTLRGSGPANSIITLRYKTDGGSYASTTVSVDSTGHWTWTPSALAKGSWTFEVQNAGQSGWNSFTLTIDPDLDRNPTIDSALDNAGPVTGSLASGASTDDTTPTLRGSGAANSTITLRYKLGSGEYASTTVNVDSAGKWTWTPSALAKGSWTFEVQKPGQSGWSSFQLTVDPALDLKPTIDSAWDDVGAVTGSLKSGDTTDDSTPTLRGRGVAGSVIYFQSGTWDGAWENAGSTVVKADGSWEWTSPALSQNTTWEFRAMARLDGAESDWSGKFVLEYNNPAPTITDAFDDFGAETGNLASGDTTDDQTPTLRGTAPADSVVMIRAQYASGETTYSVKADADGKWSWTPEKGLAKGEWNFQVKQFEAENWGESFELNITKEYSGNWGVLDFENLAGREFKFGNEIRFNDNSRLAFVSNGDLVFNGKVVKTPDNAPDGWSNQCLNLLTSGGFGIWTAVTGWGRSSTFSELGCNIWNRGSKDATFSFTYLYPNDSTPRQYTFVVKAGELLSFDSTDYTGIGIPNFWTCKLTLDNYIDGIYIDNIYSVEEDIVTRPLISEEPENIVHFLDGVDKLTEHAITGSETQVDTLQLTGKDQLLDLSQHQAEIQSVEIFDIRGSGDNTLKIDLDALLHYGEKDLFIEDGKTQLMVNGDAGDVVQLKDILPEGSDISEWQHQQGTVTVAGVEYEVYSHGDDAELLVQQGVKTELI